MAQHNLFWIHAVDLRSMEEGRSHSASIFTNAEFQTWPLSKKVGQVDYLPLFNARAAAVNSQMSDAAPAMLASLIRLHDRCANFADMGIQFSDADALIKEIAQASKAIDAALACRADMTPEEAAQRFGARS